ncbi:MAG: hypothetical protein Q4D14_00555 [Bacteroidales bacterium]|nr:hypothetical protein [Bacteroidales bacterium]
MTTLYRIGEKGTDQVTEQVKNLVLGIGNERLLAKEIMQRMGLTHREHFRADILLPALKVGLIERTMPQSPNSPQQRYYLTDKGKSMLATCT